IISNCPYVLRKATYPPLANQTPQNSIPQKLMCIFPAKDANRIAQAFIRPRACWWHKAKVTRPAFVLGISPGLHTIAQSLQFLLIWSIGETALWVKGLSFQGHP